MTNRSSERIPLVLFFCLAVMAAAACRDLRGWTERSADGKTYLVVDEGCRPADALMIDGQRWPHAEHQAGAIAPGVHKIRCGTNADGDIGFAVSRGTTFHFDYWGP